MGEHSIDNKWNARQPIEGVFVKEIQHNSLFIKEEFPVDNFDVSDFIKQEQSEETSSSASTVIEDGVIVSTDVVSTPQESIVIKDELIIKDPEHEELEQQFSLTNISLQTTEKISLIDQAHSSQPMESDDSEASIQPQKLAQEKVSQDWTRVNIKNDKASHFTEDKQVQSSIKKYQCCLCNKAFTRRNTLSRHKLTMHFGIKQYQCDVCNKAFTQLYHLSQHKLTHSTIKNYECDVCNRTFKLLKSLSVHKLSHSGIKKYQCDVCNKIFTQSSGLTVHKRTHSEVRKYQCDMCDKAFKQSSHLSTHKLTHSRIKNYNCGDCGKAFTRPRSLTKHKLIHNAL